MASTPSRHIHAGRPRVPGPPPATDPRRSAVDISGERVGLHPVARRVLGAPDAEGGIEQTKDPLCALSVPKGRVREAEPRCGVGILAPILADSGRVCANISRVVEGAVERGPKEEHEPVGLSHELVVRCPHRCTHPDFVAVGRPPRKDRPGLRDGVDTALAALRGPHERTVVVESAQIPRAIPGDVRDLNA
jgi:hypothetical protein